MSRLIFPEIQDNPKLKTFLKQASSSSLSLAPKLARSHSLEAWGYRLNSLKADFKSEEGPSKWCEFSQEMLDYCIQDVRLNFKIFQFFLKYIGWHNLPFKALAIEADFADCISKQIQHGFPFDKNKAEQLLIELEKSSKLLFKQIKKQVPDKEITTVFVPKRANKTLGYTEGVPVHKTTIQEFNPNSGKQIAEYFTSKGWKPKKFTEKGNIIIDETVLKQDIKTELALLIADYKLVQKRLAALSSGSAALLSKYDPVTKCIHGDVNTIGTVTGRCTHSNPNIAQVPSVREPWGKEFRSCFYSTNNDDFVLLGCDVSGLELRCLAHYMGHYDNGSYTNIIVHGDIHAKHQEVLKLASRDLAKRFIYAFLYGAGAASLGSILTDDKAKQKSAGERAKKRFLYNIKGLQDLNNDLVERFKKGQEIKAIDGRPLYIRKTYRILNSLLQSAGAILVKQATIRFLKHPKIKNLQKQGLLHMVAHIHDEFQLLVHKKHADVVGHLAVDAVRQTATDFNLRCPLDAEFRIGNNWAETH